MFKDNYIEPVMLNTMVKFIIAKTMFYFMMFKILNIILIVITFIRVSILIAVSLNKRFTMVDTYIAMVVNYIDLISISILIVVFVDILMDKLSLIKDSTLY